MSYLKDRRVELAMTQGEVAKAIGVSTACVSLWESGNIANMKRNYIAAYAKVLQTSPSFIMTGVDEGERFHTIDDEIANMIRQLDERDTEALRVILRGMTKGKG